MIDKVIISACIDKQTRDKIKEIAKKEKRSFSNMIDLFLQKALAESAKKNNGNKI